MEITENQIKHFKKELKETIDYYFDEMMDCDNYEYNELIEKIKEDINTVELEIDEGEVE